MQLPPTPRNELLRALVAEVVHLYPAGRVIVAVDGIDGAGKTAFGDDLAAAFEESGHTAVRATMDDFHRPREERYRLGRESPEAFYRDSFDYLTFRRVLVDPFRMAGSAGFQRASFDLRRDAPALTSWTTTDTDSVLIVDGIFLNRPELQGIWNYSILLDVPWDLAYARLAERWGVDEEPQAGSNTRYREGQELYFAEAAPRERANAIVDNTDPDHPLRVFADHC
jgi:uridine kinase